MLNNDSFLSSNTIDIAQRSFVEKPKLPRVSLVIVNYNTLHHIKRCLPSVFSQIYPDYEVIVVDNASIDGSVEYIEQQYPKVKIVKNVENLGYTGGNNVGFKFATGKYIAILNPDTKIEPDWLQYQVSALEANPQAGLAAGKVLFMDNPKQINSCGLDITFTGLSFLRGLGEPAEKYLKPEVIFGAAGAAFVIKRKVLEEINGFDELLFIYYDDTDLSLRANLAGYTCLYVPESVAYHQYIFKFSARKCFLQERNRYYSLLTVLRVPTLIALLPTFLLSEAIAWGYALLKGFDHVKGKYQSHVWIIKNWRQVLEARRQVQRLRRISDRMLINRFSHRLNFYNTTEPWFTKLLTIILNPLVFLWGIICRAVVIW